jgi:uncharacterized protein (DUF2236 family)
MSRADPVPLGPDSLTWKYFGLSIGLTLGSVPQLHQLMHPVLGHAVDEHSNVKDDPFDRLIRSMGPIYGVIYDGPDAATTATTVRKYHDRINGTLPSGEHYSALHPEVFIWAHATFVHGLIYGYSNYIGPFSRADQEQMYAESLQWFALYGVSDRTLPKTLDEFDDYWAHYVNDVLEPTPAARWLLATFRRPPAPPGFGWIPAPLWRVLRVPAGHAAVVLATGSFDPVVRDKLGLPWRPRHRLEHAALRQVLRLSVRVSPLRFRYHPRPLAGWKRAAAERGVPVTALVPPAL